MEGEREWGRIRRRGSNESKETSNGDGFGGRGLGKHGAVVGYRLSGPRLGRLMRVACPSAREKGTEPAHLLAVVCVDPWGLCLSARIGR